MKHYSRTIDTNPAHFTNFLGLIQFWDILAKDVHAWENTESGCYLVSWYKNQYFGVPHCQRNIFFKDMIEIYLNQLSECGKLEPSPAKIKCKSSSRIDGSILNKYLKFRIQMFQTNILSFYQKNNITCITQTSFSAHLYIIVPFQIKQK